MGRHEIRLRRKKMTSRRIESHKDYYDLLKRHERTSVGKKLLRVVIYIIIFIGLIMLGYFALRKIDRPQNDTPKGDAQSKAYKTSRPGVLINVSLNTKNHGKA
ncbi:hypothetical protein JMN32_08045 [Fulvivirga sp. 29W222]|uniref:Uncharacterized protein n=1 Tax=Fulvivirga marina TaxID=2494733 RepID=A0A937KDN7_9BACT|nr:hypothetical protein [Fulvivirga marina]MBL6446255.1 hypothetical protein [Fulvivirga marina]